MQQFAQRHQKLQAAMKLGWISFMQAAARPHRKRLRQVTPAPAVDPVALTMLAVNRLGLATLRTATSGKAMTVSVPDAHTADIFRAALDEMQKTRFTDRLVEVVVIGEPLKAKRGTDAGEA